MIKFKNLTALALLLSFTAQAGLPPTTIKGQSDASPVTTFNLQVPGNGITRLGGPNALIELGQKNFFVDPGAENPTTPSNCALYNDGVGAGAANIPIDATGGSVSNLAFARTTSSPLSGAGSYLLTQTNSQNIQGEGLGCAFTIDSAFKGAPITVNFDFNASSTFVAADGQTVPKQDGTTTTTAGNSDVQVFVYDVTNAVLLPVSPMVITAKGTNNFHFSGTFPSSSTSTSYRVAWHVATSSANATGWTFKFDNVTISPVSAIRTPALTDWQAFTPTGSWGTNTTYTGQFKRDGDSAVIQEKLALSGAPNNSSLTLNLPSGLTIDTSKLLSSDARDGIDSFGTANNLSAPFPVFAHFNNSSSVTVRVENAGATYLSGDALSTTVPFTWANGHFLTITFRVPISGWSSNVQVMGVDTDAKAVAFHGTSTSASVNSFIDFQTVATDTHNQFNHSTPGYVIPVSGNYAISLNMDFTATTPTLNQFYTATLYKGGSTIQDFIGRATSTTTMSDYPASSYIVLPCIAGEVIQAQGRTNLSSGAINVGSGIVKLSISRISGPSVGFPALRRQVLTWNASTTWVVPDNVLFAQVYGRPGASGGSGGGGGGGGSSANNGGGGAGHGGGGGGSSSFFGPVPVTLTPGNTITVTVGAGGSGGSAGSAGAAAGAGGSGGAGGNGGISSFGSVQFARTTTAGSTGGTGGSNGSAGGASGGAGGTTAGASGSSYGLVSIAPGGGGNGGAGGTSASGSTGNAGSGTVDLYFGRATVLGGVAGTVGTAASTFGGGGAGSGGGAGGGTTDAGIFGTTQGVAPVGGNGGNGGNGNAAGVGAAGTAGAVGSAGIGGAGGSGGGSGGGGGAGSTTGGVGGAGAAGGAGSDGIVIVEYWGW